MAHLFRTLIVGVALAAAPLAAQPAPPPLPADAASAPMWTPLERVAGVAKPRDPAEKPLKGVDFAEAIAMVEAGQPFALLIWQGGALRVERYWNGATADSRPEPASMAKSAMGLAFGPAVAAGKLSLDDRADRWLTEWTGDPRGAITVRQLLTMTSGLKPLSREGGPASQAAQFLTGADLTIPLKQALQAEPGAKFEYQNSVTQLACLILERATGMRYADWLAKAVWTPIGAADAQLWLDKGKAHPRCYASLLARPRDWLRLGLLIKDRGKAAGKPVVHADWIDAMTAPSPRNPNYGFQLWRASPHVAQRFYNDQREGYAVTTKTPSLADDLVFFDGYGGQRVYISRSRDLVIVKLGQTDLGWDDTALPNAAIRALDR